MLVHSELINVIQPLILII